MKKGDEPAFPHIYSDPMMKDRKGLTVRQLYAALVSPAFAGDGFNDWKNPEEMRVAACFEWADTMLAFEEKEAGEKE